MGYEKSHYHTEIVTREQALRLGEAANNVSGVTVHAIGDEGEKYSPKSGGVRTIREGHVQVAVNSTGDTSPLYREAEKLESEQKLAA